MHNLRAFGQQLPAKAPRRQCTQADEASADGGAGHWAVKRNRERLERRRHPEDLVAALVQHGQCVFDILEPIEDRNLKAGASGVDECP
jgi:hypothetical protein